MGKLWVQVREPASINKMQGKQDRPSTSTSGLYTHAHMCRHTHTSLHMQRGNKWSLDLRSQSLLIVAKSWLTGSGVCPTAWTVDTAAPMWGMANGSRPFSSTSPCCSDWRDQYVHTPVPTVAQATPTLCCLNWKDIFYQFFKAVQMHHSQEWVGKILSATEANVLRQLPPVSSDLHAKRRADYNRNKSIITFHQSLCLLDS